MQDVETQLGTNEPNEAEAAAEVDTGQVMQVRVDPTAQPVSKSPAPSALSPRLLIGLGVAAVAGLLCIFGLIHSMSPAGPPDFQNLGAGVSNATGLRGSLKARWQSKSAQYQLEIKPIHPLESAGFSFVVANPPGPLSLHMKLLDSAGYEVCGKDVLFPFDPASPGEADRERGQDLLQTTVDENGKVASLSTQGTLPCTPEQYQQLVYWDFSTNFPALAEQDQLMNKAADAKKAQEAQERMRERMRNAQRNVPRSTFYLEGDEKVAWFDALRDELVTPLGRTFRLTGAGQQATARLWADNGVLFHYKCDQHSHCVLARAGGGQSLSVTLLQ